MIKFSETTQAFYNVEFDYGDSLPKDLVDVPADSHIDLNGRLNQGRHIFSNLTWSEPKPSYRCEWIDGAWFDPETPEEKRARYLRTLRPLTRRQFMLVLVEYNLDDSIDGLIEGIEDIAVKKRMKIEYKESTTFERESPAVISMCQLLSLSDSQIDSMWERGLTL